MTAVGLAVVHSYGRLIPRDFPITDLQQISGPDGIGRITCALNSGSTMIRHEATATLVLSLPDSLNNRDMYCLSTTNYFFFFPSPNSKYTLCKCTNFTTDRYVRIYSPFSNGSAVRSKQYNRFLFHMSSCSGIQSRVKCKMIRLLLNFKPCTYT